MPTKHHPRRGSLQFWPRKRCSRQYAKIRSWIKKDDSKVLGFPGYKVGMTHVIFNDSSPATTKGMDVSKATTILEVPPMKVQTIRFYKNNDYGTDCVGYINADKADKYLRRKIKPSKKKKEVEDYDDVKIVVHTNPNKAGIGKKKPEIFELAISGKDAKAKYEFAKELLGKDIDIDSVFKTGDFVDVHSVTRGRGHQGTVKIFGVKIRQHKAEKTKRGVGTLGAWTPKKTHWGVAQAKKHGYYMRTEYNKELYYVGDDLEQINRKSGFRHYGLVKGKYVLVKGSIPGPAKRMVILTDSIRKRKNKSYPITFKFIKK